MNTNKYVVTDPCYILPKDKWQKCCKVFDEYSDNEVHERFNQVVTESLREFSDDNEAMAVDTGYGDWSNMIEGSSSNKILQSDFAADSGMVCICKYTDSVKEALSKYVNQGSFAILELEGGVTFTFDMTDEHWTQLFIQDERDSFETLPPDDEVDEYFE